MPTTSVTEVNPLFIAIPSLLGCLVFLNLVMRVAAKIGGWSALAAAYPGREQIDGETWRFRTVRLGAATRYKSSITVGADREGLHLSVIWLLNSGHPPIFVPWNEIKIIGRESGIFGLTYTGLVFQRCPGLQVWFFGRVLDEAREWVEAHGGARLPEAPAVDEDGRPGD